MKKSKFYLLSGLMGLVVTTLVVSSMASADELFTRGPARNLDPDKVAAMEEHHEAMEAYHEAMQTAIENGDYAAWKEAVDSVPRITDFVNESNFDQFVQMHNYMQDGDFEAAQEIRDELGLEAWGLGRGMMGFHKGFHMGQKLGSQ